MELLFSPATRIRRGSDWEDRISKLPNEVLALIFTSLPTKEVGRTSILSKRWRYAWTHNPNIEFDDQFIIKYSDDAEQKLAYFKDSVDRALFCHRGSAIEKCSFHCHTHQVSTDLYGWISAALYCNVQELSIRSVINVQALPPSLFTCGTLVVLKIKGTFLLNLPVRVCFPCLKTLSLKSVIYEDDLAMQRLLSSCPLLEDLKISRQEWDGVLITAIFVPSLRRLSITQCYFEGIEGYEFKTVIYAPNLEYLYLNDGESKVIDVNISHSLVRADINDMYGTNILYGISQVTKLILYRNTFEKLGIQNVVLPIFRNLIFLELGVGGGWNFLSNLLSSTPNLETLIFAEGLVEPDDDSNGGFCDFHWDPPESPPACLLLHLKDIVIYNFVGRPCECFFIRYLLNNGLVLDNMDIYWYKSGPRRTKSETISHDKIMSYKRASLSCVVEFDVLDDDSNSSSSLDRADIDGSYGPNDLHGISLVGELVLSGDAFGKVRNAVLPIFQNLIHLELGVDGGGWNFLSNLLSSTPNLETLIFAEGLLEPDDYSRRGYRSFYWNPPESPPACLEHHLKEIEIHNFVGRPCERFIVRYLLDNALVLDNMSIYWSSSNPKFSRAETISHGKIMSYGRASLSCEVEFFAPST